MKAGYFSEDIEEFLFLLYKHEVRYLIVGGEAVIYYGYPRLTGDVDFFYGNSKKNVENFYQALLDFWDNDIPGIKKKEELKTPGYVIQFGVPPNRIDLMNTIDGINFKQAWKDKTEEKLTINNKKMPVYFLSLNHLILNKQKSNRDKDKDDLSYLMKIENSD